MRTEKVIIEVSADGLFSAYMPSNEYGFGLAGYGDTEQEAIEDFYECVSDIRDIEEAEGRAFPELQFQFEHAVGYAASKTVTGCVAEDPAGYNPDEDNVQRKT